MPRADISLSDNAGARVHLGVDQPRLARLDGDIECVPIVAGVVHLDAIDRVAVVKKTGADEIAR